MDTRQKKYLICKKDKKIKLVSDSVEGRDKGGKLLQSINDTCFFFMPYNIHRVIRMERSSKVHYIISLPQGRLHYWRYRDIYTCRCLIQHHKSFRGRCTTQARNCTASLYSCIWNTNIKGCWKTRWNNLKTVPSSLTTPPWSLTSQTCFKLFT